VFEVLTSV